MNFRRRIIATVIPPRKTTSKKDENYIAAMRKYIDDSERLRETAVQRFDAMILAIGTVAIGYTANYLKDYSISHPKADLSEVQTAQLMFLIAVVGNLVSQVASLFTNTASAKHGRNALCKYENDKIPNDWSEKKFEWVQWFIFKRRQFWHILNNTLNIIAFFALLSGIILFLDFTGLFWWLR